MKIYETERSDDGLGTYEQRWACEPPAQGSTFQVTRDEWVDDYSVRIIHAWR